MKSLLLEEINKIDKPLAKYELEKFHLSKIRYQKGTLKINKEIQRIKFRDGTSVFHQMGKPKGNA